MASRKPLVLVDNKHTEIPVGDVLLGIPLYAPAYQQSGTLLRLALTATYGTPVYKQAGTQLVVGAVL